MNKMKLQNIEHEENLFVGENALVSVVTLTHVKIRKQILDQS